MQTEENLIIVPPFDYERLQRAVDIYAEIGEVLGERTIVDLRQDRIRLLALMRLVDTLSTNLAKMSARGRPAGLDWAQIVGVRAHVSRIKTTPDFDAFRRLLPDVLPRIMRSVHSAYQASTPAACLETDAMCAECNLEVKPQSKGNGAFGTLFRKAYKNEMVGANRFYPNTLSKLCRYTGLGWERHRVEVELWFRDLPEGQRSQLYGRLRSTDDTQFGAANFELFLHHYLSSRGFQLEVEPSLSIYKPDFLVSRGDARFYLEALTVWSEMDRPEARGQVACALNAIDHPIGEYLLSVEFLALPAQVDNSALAEHVRKWQNSIGLQCVQPHVLEVDSFGLRCRITAVRRESVVSSGNVYAWSAPHSGSNSSERAVRRALHKSIKFAAHAQLPIVLAVGGRDNVVWDELTLCQQLYGDLEISVTRLGERSVRIMHKGGGFSADKNTRISAILFCNSRWERSRMIHDVKIMHNPWARHPLPADLLTSMPQLLPSAEQPQQNLRWRFST